MDFSSFLEFRNVLTEMLRPAVAVQLIEIAWQLFPHARRDKALT